MYYILSEKPLGSFDDLAVIDSCPRVPGVKSWLLGDALKKNISEPLVFEMSDDYNGRMPDFFDSRIPLFSKKLVAALNNCGVENFIAYDSKLVDQEGGVISCEYFAINILGVLSVANFEKSKQPEGAYPTLVDASFNFLSIFPIVRRLSEMVIGVGD